MKLQEIFDHLGAGEFSQLSIGGKDAGVLNESNWANVIGHVNLALTALFKRFTLKEGRLVLQLRNDRTLYKLSSTFAVNARRGDPVRYILDTPDDRFVDDIIKVEKVLTDDEYELGLNDASDQYSVTTPTALSLRVPQDLIDKPSDLPEALKTVNLTIVYRANHPKIVQGLGYFDPNRVEVQLPDTHLEALLYYVAGRVQNPVGMTNEFNASNNYMARFEAACQELEGKGLQVDQGETNMRLVRNGWV